ncbi:uncharacterized protein LOC119989390 [Tripterygium wilfordii]|uniref:uncharacterized protein LOC119989390 n=1 Tax=Tripterygium wilfordii TaxID=458696 RepID=UPI0018F85DD9|nr:uncharacterized protein LOC119989390 [Tripterygium wilfordii]
MDAVVNSMATFSLTAEEGELVILQQEEISDNLKDFPNSAVGKILSHRILNKTAVRTVFRRAWGFGDDLRIFDLGPNFFQFIFPNEFALNRVLDEAPWYMDNHLLVLKKWELGMSVENAKFDSCPFWIHAHGLPLVCHSPKVAQSLGSAVGGFISAEDRSFGKSSNAYLRFRALVYLDKPIRRGCFVLTPDGSKVWVSFRYERLMEFCFYCGVLGHDEKRCSLHFEAVKNNKDVSSQYGPWLSTASMGGRHKNSNTSSGSKHNSAGSSLGESGKAHTTYKNLNTTAVEEEEGSVGSIPVGRKNGPTGTEKLSEPEMEKVQSSLVDIGPCKQDLGANERLQAIFNTLVGTGSSSGMEFTSGGTNTSGAPTPLNQHQKAAGSKQRKGSRLKEKARNIRVHTTLTQMEVDKLDLVVGSKRTRIEEPDNSIPKKYRQEYVTGATPSHSLLAVAAQNQPRQAQ